MKRISRLQVTKDLRKSKLQLYEDIGTQYLVYKHRIPDQKAVFAKGEIIAIKSRYPKSRLRSLGRAVYLKNRLKIKKSICVQFHWCEKSKILKKHRNKITYGVLISNVIAIWLPPWAAASAFYALTMKIHKDLDKYCKCKKTKRKIITKLRKSKK